MSNWNALIPGAPFDWALIPLNGRKRPINPETGELKSGWELQDGYDIGGISELNGCVKAVGLLLGEKSGGVLQVDFDGPNSVAKFIEVFNRKPTELPRTNGVTSGKKSRGSRFFLVDPDWWPSLRGRKVWKDDKGEICLELRWSGHQAVIAGAHPETKGYSWLDNSSPADIEMATAPDWLLEPLIRSEASYEPVEVSEEDAERAVAMLKHIDPTDRTDYDGWLDIGMALHHTDPGLASAWVEWSRQMPNFEEEECLHKWQGFADYKGVPLTIGSLHHYAKQGGYKEPKRKKPEAQPSGEAQDDALDEWDSVLTTLVNPEHHCFEKNIIRRQIRAQTAAQQADLRVSPDQVRARLIQKQRELIADTEAKGVAGGEVAKFAEKRWLIQALIAEGCLTGIASFAKVGKTKALTELAASLIHQQPFMGNPEWMPAPGAHKLILWWIDQPGVDSAQYLKARGLMQPDGTLNPQIVRLYTQEDSLCWDDQGMDELIQITTANPDSVLLTDSFYANVQPIYGSDQDADSGGALIDVQTYCSKRTKAHICAFHSSQEKDKVGVEAMRGHGSAKGVVSSTISLHFLEKKSTSGSNKWVSDKENPHRRMVFEGRGPYEDLLVRLDGEAGTWKVIGKFDKALAELQSNDRKGETIGRLTEGQRQTLEFLAGACGIWKDPNGATANQVAACRVQRLNREPTSSEIQSTRRQLNALVKDQLASQTKKGQTFKYTIRS